MLFLTIHIFLLISHKQVLLMHHMKQREPLPWFQAWFKFIFPIKKDERKKVFLLLFLKFLISAVYCILTSLKDTTLVTANHSAAEVIPIIKGSVVFPISIGILMLYTKLNNHLKQSTLFYSIILFFLSFILLYGFILYPNIDQISPHTTANWLSNYTEGKYLHWIAIFRYWIHVLFFVIAEIWGQLVIVVLYWVFANNICKMSDAKRFYAILIAAGYLAPIIVSPLILFYTKRYSNIDFLLTVQALLKYVGFLLLLIIFIYCWASRTIKPNITESIKSTTTPKKLRLSLWDSLKHVSSSRYLMSIATMIVSCGFSINILEGTWKSYLKEEFPKAADYQIFTSNIIFWTGIVALITSLFFSGGMLRKFGWETVAKVSPVTIGITGCLFFLISYCKNSISDLSTLIGSKLVLYIVILGGIQNLLGKVVKYAFHDNTTQIAYIPLDQEAKIKGKAAIDILGSRLGKAGSSWIQIALLELFHTNSIQPLSGILFIFLLITTILWYRATDNISSWLTILEEKESKNI